MRLLWSAEELSRHRFPSTYVIEPIFPRGGIALCYGKRGIGKSHFALTLAVCLTEGGVLFGRYRTRRCPVVYVQADMAAAIMQDRVRCAQRAFSLDRLFLAFPDFLNVPQLVESHELVQRIRAVEPELIIWDTLRQIHRMDMNSDETPAWVYGKAKHLFPDVAHVFIHHDRKSTIDDKELDPEESFRGSGAWIDNADLGIKLSAVGRHKLRAEFSKVRTCDTQPPLALSLHLPHMLTYASGESVGDLIARWRRQYPTATDSALERFLLNSFAAPPHTIETLLRRGVAPDVAGVPAEALPATAGEET